jgi:site-specific recombinase XerD
MSGAPVLAGSPGFPSLLQDFFCQRLIGQRNVTGRTVASYRDAFRLLLNYAESRLHRSPVAVTLADLDAPFVLGFLDHLEKERGNCARSRNLRLVAIRSFLRYTAHRDPTALPMVERVLAIPTKRFDRPLLGFLSYEEMQVILESPDRASWSGQRDHAMLTTLYNTGARVSEIVALRVVDLDLVGGASVRIRGKGRKERVTPLWPSTAKLLRAWLDRTCCDPGTPLFPNRHGRPMSRSGVEQRLRAAVTAAEQRCPSLRGRRISPHTLRHTIAMHLLQSGVDLSNIALWLGHESPATTHRYLEADLAMKERALQALQEPLTRLRGHWPPNCRFWARERRQIVRRSAARYEVYE